MSCSNHGSEDWKMEVLLDFLPGTHPLVSKPSDESLRRVKDKGSQQRRLERARSLVRGHEIAPALRDFEVNQEKDPRRILGEYAITLSYSTDGG